MSRLRQRRLGVSPALVKFVMVGGAAFVLGQVVLFLLYDALPILPEKHTRVDFGLFTHPDISLLIASAVCVEVAIAFKFFALETWAFTGRARHGHPVVRFLRFNASCFASMVIVLAAINVLTPVFDLSPYLATTVGTLFGFAVNWIFSAYIIWPHRATDAPAPATIP